MFAKSLQQSYISFSKEHDTGFQCCSGVEESASLLLHPAGEDDVECLRDQPDNGETEIFIQVEVKENNLLRY